MDPPGQAHGGDPATHGLNLSNGNVVFGYGGNDGDCSTYSGWVARCPRAAGRRATTRRCRSAMTGRCGWAAPRPRSTRPATSGSPPGTGRRRRPTTSATRSSSCRPAWLAPSTSPRATGRSTNSHDQDLGSTAPALLSNGTVAAGRQVIHGLPREPVQPRRHHRHGIATASVCLRQRRRRRRRRRRDRRLRAVRERGSGDADHVPLRLRALANGERRHGPPITRRRPRLVHRRLLALRAQPRQRRDGRAALRRGPGQPLPHPVGGRRPPPGPEPATRSRLLRLGGDPGPALAAATAPPNSSYWLVASDGGIFTFGNAGFYGSTGGIRLDRPIVGMAPTPPRTATGWWPPTAASSATATRPSSAPMGGKPLNAPDRRHGGTPDGGGYWVVASDGGIFSFGDAAFHGSMGGKPLNKPIVGMARPTTVWATGWSPPTAASSASATPPSTAPWAAAPEQADRGHGGHA